MHPCPFCSKPLHSTETGGLPHDPCVFNSAFSWLFSKLLR